MTETILNLCDIDIAIRQASKGREVYLWNAYRYRHTITIKANGISKRFSFHGSIHDYQNCKDRLNKEDLIYVLECVISDGITGLMDCKEFFVEFGYDDPCEGLKTLKACQSTLQRLEQMGLNEDMLYELSEDIREIEEGE
jgi:hypothetical protein